MRGVCRGGGAYEGGTAGVGVHMRGVLQGVGSALVLSKGKRYSQWNKMLLIS